ncbi:MAG: NAD(P)/FAD-dependent oxidoreductase [Candidatus Saccharimonadales bacterium]
MSKQNVLIVGGGFGGVKAALELADDPNFAVTLLSDDDEMRYYPTLYHTATGSRRANSSIPLKDIFEGKEVSLVKATASTIDRKAKTIATTEGESYNYDVLILALGVVTNYFGIPGLPEYSYSIKTQKEVERFKAHLHQQMEDDRRPDLHYVIVGAGPTGIELAGALPGYLKHIMQNHGISDRKVHIDIIEALPQLLPRLPKRTSKVVAKRLKRLGVDVYLGKAVQGQTADELTVSGKPIRSHTVVWTAGVTNHPFFKENNFTFMGRGKVGVDVYLQTEENIYVIGDNANTPYSGLAQTALHDGKFVAENLKRRAAGKKMKSYVAKEPVTAIPAGPQWAVVQWGLHTFSGRLGWLILQASYLIGFHDIEPWPKATKQFLAEYIQQDNCQVCTAAQTA